MKEKLIVKKIKELRLSRKMTLDRLAELTKLTKGYLSRIENSSKAPPVSTLAKIADALSIDITEFFSLNEASTQSVDISIIKKDARLRIGGRGAPHGYVYEALAYSMPGKNMEPYLISIRDECQAPGFQHEGEEFIHMLEGKMEFCYGNDIYILERGDSAYFNAAISHTGRSIGTKNARFLCIIYSYKRI